MATVLAKSKRQRNRKVNISVTKQKSPMVTLSIRVGKTGEYQASMPLAELLKKIAAELA
jgi:hypothetical protein